MLLALFIIAQNGNLLWDFLISVESGLLSFFWIVGGIVAAYFLLIPLLIIATFKVKAHPKVLLFDPDTNPPPSDVVDFFEEMHEQLEAIDFTRTGSVIVPDLMENVRTVLAIYTHERDETLAMVTAIWGFANDEPVEQAKYLEFMTEFENHELENLSTGNNGKVGAFKERSVAPEYRLPQLEEASKIYYCHKQLIEREAPTARKKMTLRDEYQGNLRKYIGDGILKKAFEVQIPRGYLRYDAETDLFRTTFIGGYRICWRVIPPLKNYLEAGYRRQGRRLERELV